MKKRVCFSCCVSIGYVLTHVFCWPSDIVLSPCGWWSSTFRVNSSWPLPVPTHPLPNKSVPLAPLVPHSISLASSPPLLLTLLFFLLHLHTSIRNTLSLATLRPPFGFVCHLSTSSLFLITYLPPLSPPKHSHNPSHVHLSHLLNPSRFGTVSSSFPPFLIFSYYIYYFLPTVC